MTTVAVYTCSHCGAAVSKDATACPHCHVGLVGVRCLACQFAGAESDFVDDRCPRCGTRVAPPPPRTRTPRAPGQKSPAAHGWASAAVPGLGTMLCGRTRRGLLILGLSALAMIGVNALVAVSDSGPAGIGTLLALPLWVWGIVDGYRSAEQWNVEHGPRPARTDVDVEFDAEGRLTHVAVPQGPWTTSRQGDATFHTRKAATLLHAAEVLKRLSDIPGLTYYVVETPDGNLGRDLFGFYTEAPVKTSGIATGSPIGVGVTVELAHLKDSGDAFKQQRTVANLTDNGKYARLVLLMECGRCGYESPVETEAGPLVRQCYCCGATNTGIRGSIAVMLAPGNVVEI